MRESDIMPHHLDQGMVQKMGDGLTAAGEEIVGANDFVMLIQQMLAEMRTRGSRTARDQYSFHWCFRW
jgi:hypothetical protein